MNTIPWLERGFVITEGLTVGQLISSGLGWQLYQTSNKGYMLATEDELYTFWLSLGLLPESVWKQQFVENRSLFLIWASHDSVIASVSEGPFPQSTADIDAFTIALKKSRDRVGLSISFRDSLYIEQYSVVLPTRREPEDVDDKTVLGRYISAGVDISVERFERLCEIVSWVSPYWLEEILASNGFLLNRGAAEALERSRTEKQSKEEPKRVLEENRGRRITAQIPSTQFSLPGRPILEQFFNEHIVEIVQHREDYLRMGIDFPSAIVLYGPPGCGKTFAVEQLIDYLQWPSYYIDSGTIGSSYIHETSKKIAGIFTEAMNHAPSVLVIDEMEAFLTNRAGTDSSHIHHTEEVAEFLRKIPEAAKKHVLIIAMTNLIESIDPAILRRGRFDHIIEVKMPTSEEVCALLKHLLSALPVADDIDYEGLSKKMSGRALSDVTFVIKEAGRKAVRSKQNEISNELLLAAVESLPAKTGEKRKIGF